MSLQKTWEPRGGGGHDKRYCRSPPYAKKKDNRYKKKNTQREGMSDGANNVFTIKLGHKGTEGERA
ncbi:unnamed protein product [Ectocarpus sp. CCAP 1310/34]|nr:unnamed protein product [Ectocarpus sp. CCAP 1310/34]